MAKQPIWTPDEPLFEVDDSTDWTPKVAEPLRRDSKRHFNNWSCACCDFVPGDPCFGCPGRDELEITLTVNLSGEFCRRPSGTAVAFSGPGATCRWRFDIPDPPFGTQEFNFEMTECPEVDNVAKVWVSGRCQSDFDVFKLGIPANICDNDFELHLADQSVCYGSGCLANDYNGACAGTADVIGTHI